MQTPQFEVHTYIGSELAQMKVGGERPPRSAKLVASVDMGSGPGGGDYRTYLLSTEEDGSGWTLWQKGDDYDTGKPLYCQVAYGSPCQDIDAKHAAERLLTKSWEDERDLEGISPGVIVMELPGLLTFEDIERIERAVFNGPEEP